MGAHFHEHHAEMMRWPWKVFCRKWARFLDATVVERRRELRRKRRMADDRERMALGEKHGELHGGLGG